MVYRVTLHTVKIALEVVLVWHSMHDMPFAIALNDNTHMRILTNIINRCNYTTHNTRASAKQKIAFG
jgi:mannitol/fructose-specific phosphotransferase system IIA component